MIGFYVVNLELGYPTSSEAIVMLRKEIEWAKTRKEKYLYIIHGYGSSGKGGVIRQKARQLLDSFCKNNKIRAVIKGEEFSIFNNDAREMIVAHKEMKELSKKYNPGITIVIL